MDNKEKSATEWRAPGDDPSVAARRRHLPSFAGKEAYLNVSTA